MKTGRDDLHEAVKKALKMCTSRSIYHRHDDEPMSLWEETKERAGRFMSDLCHAIETAGHQIDLRSLHGGRRWRLVAVVNGEPLPMMLEEAGNLKTGQASSRLTFYIDTVFVNAGLQKKWTDAQRSPIEEKIASIVSGLEAIAPHVRRHRLEHEQRLAKWQEAERKRVLAEHQRERFNEDFVAWQRVEQMRRFLVDVELLLVRDPEMKPRMDAWIEWATDLISETDPLATTAAHFLGRYDSNEPEASLPN